MTHGDGGKINLAKAVRQDFSRDASYAYTKPLALPIPGATNHPIQRLTVSADKPDSLIKFTDGAVAIKILSEQKLRWSSPDRFGDPFELSAKSDFNFDTNAMLDSTVKLASSMIFAPETPRGDSPLINAIRRWRDEARFNYPEEAHGILRDLLGKMVDYRQDQLNVTRGKWQEYVRKVRVCCFIHKPDNVNAWEQFADLHRGVAIRFAIGDTAPFTSARPVVYQTERPQLTSLREQLGAILHNRKDSAEDRFKDHFFTKGPHRKLEQEWRCLTVSEQDISITHTQPAEWYDDLGFAADQITAVFFGIDTCEHIKQQLRELVQERYPNAKILQAVPGKIGYTIEFEKVGKS